MPAPRRPRGAAKAPPPVRAQSYVHDAESPLRPETVKRHEVSQREEPDRFGDPRRSITGQLLRAYEHCDRRVNRMVLGVTPAGA
jgi:hypothetical protein